MHASLVMQDKETDSYWSIITGDAVAGSFEGTRLEELPIGTKTQWKDWRARHPQTLVLSVDGAEHDDNNPYDTYFAADSSYRGKQASDRRLPTKAPIYAFLHGDRALAVEHAKIAGGASFELDRGVSVFLYRPPGAAMFASTLAFEAPAGSFEERDGRWYHASGARFVPERGGFEPQVDLDSPGGFDTFWFNWSMTHPDTDLLGR